MAVPMLIEVVTLVWLRGPLLATAWPLAIIWAVTFGLYIPQYRRLMSGYNEKVMRLLIAANWIRTIGWTIRASMMLWIAREQLHI